MTAPPRALVKSLATPLTTAPRDVSGDVSGESSCVSSGAGAASAAAPSVLASALLVVGFWWMATGLTFAMQTGRSAALLTLAATTGLALYGFRLIVGSRDESTVPGARRAFLGSSLAWWWCVSVFYAGWGIDLDGAAQGDAGSFALAREAIAATWRADMLGVASIVVVGIMCWRRRNQVAIWSLAVYWGTLQAAKLNVFFGVLNSGVELLPPALRGLAVYFGPARTSWFLPFTVIVLTLITAAVARHGVRAREPFVRHGSAMLAMLLALAVLEHVVLGVPVMLPLWDAFLPSAP